MEYTVAALYRFTAIADKAALRDCLKPRFAALNICGSLLIADEGINGTLAGSHDAIESMLDLLHAQAGLTREDVKFSAASEKPFNRLKIRLKRELITFNQPHADPVNLKGTYVKPAQWDALISDPDVVVLDTRNDYETMIGTFKGAVDPNITTFTQFADYVKRELDPARHKKIAMFCTGGIRCEKASAYMRAEGFAEVYHLQGGILKYLEEIPAQKSSWQGECYVFDKRMSVGHGLVQGQYSMCFCCGFPVNETDKASPHYEEGVSCPRCFSSRNEDDKARFRMRQQNIDAADALNN